MSVPMSQYEALLEEVRLLRRRTQHVQQLAAPLISNEERYNAQGKCQTVLSNNVITTNPNLNPMMDSTGEEFLHETKPPDEFDQIDHENIPSEDECGRVSSTHMSVSSEPISQLTRGRASLYHGTWPVERTTTMWNSEPTNLGPISNNLTAIRMDQTSVMSFASSSGGAPLDRVLSSPDHSRRSSQQLEAKMDMVYSLLAMLGGQEHADMGETLLALSTSPESCLAMRQSGCIPLLVQLVQSDKDADSRKKASEALHNLVHSQPDEKLRKRETRVLKLLEQARLYTDALKNNTEFIPDPSISSGDDTANDKHPVATIAHLMKHSFDEGHRQAICQLGGIYVIANLVENEHSLHGSTNEDGQCILMRRYACMALTNLTFGDSGNKALLCSFREFMRALVVQLQSPSDELRQVTASVLRNLSWRADSVSKEILKEVGTVTGLMKAAMVDSKENTLKSILSALWNLSAHCTENKAEICAIDGALGFLVDMLSYKTPSKSLAVIENSGGILRDISSQIAVREDYREILRKHNCLQVLLEQLKSPSLTIVSNACGTLWNLSAKNGQDQESLWQMGAPAMLRSLNHSKHKMIAMGSSAALKNLLSSRPSHSLLPQMDATAKAMDLPILPTLGARKQKALLQDLDQNLRETYDNLESPKDLKKTFLKEKKDEDLCHAFSSINLNETSTSYFHQKTFSGGSSSLPYTTQKRLKRIEDETDSNDQPIDFSRKYSEKQDNLKQKKYVTSSYAETDLDQPTDYSLRYAEDDSDSDIPKNEYIQDTVKTYCTEGTPLNFSTATSMSDLRIEKIIDNEKASQNSSSIQKEENVIDEKDHCSTEDISEIETTARKSEKLQFNSGLMSPEKPVNYCEEGTPGYFSRVSSFGSLTSIPANENLKVKTGNEQCNKEIISQNISQQDSLKREIVPSENQKAVKFEQTVNYAEETPLMFSRSSSLASLDSFEQHSIHDDRSSIVSEISRFTSGVVSPDIPDSPSQTMPPSPRPRKVLEYPSTSRAAILFQRTAADGRPQPAPRSIQKPSIFEDNVTKFKEESTPVQFSTATSLSSLTIDEHEDRNLTLPKKVSPPTSQNSGSTLSANATNANVAEEKVKQDDEKKDAEPEKPANISSDSEIHISENEGDEDILADCINIGMQNRRHKSEVEAVQTTPGSKPYNYSPKRPTSGSGIPLPRRLGHNNGSGDTVKTYCTEDTPAILSHAGSQSDLSMLSSPNEKKNNSNVKDYTSDDSGSNLSGDNENILAECIQSGMPKPKPKHTNVIFNKPTPENNYLDGKDRKLTYLIAKDEVEKFAVENSPCQFSLRSSLSDLTVDGSVAGLASMKPPTSNNQQKPINNSNLSGQESLSSLSVDSVGSVENEQALLEQCISSGMPKSKSSESSQHPDLEQKDPKNAPAASAVASIPHQLEFEQIHDHRPAPPPITAGEDESDAGRSHATRDEHLKTPVTEQASIEPKKNGCEKDVDEKIVNRMLDPDAMIESLDRFTAELVLQAQSRMEKEKDLQNSVTDGGETWTDISPNDVSFPSISGSVPQVITFSDDYARKEGNLTSEMSTLTESTLIAMEATRIATTFQIEAAMAHSAGPFELDMIQPPSHLNSLTSSINELDFNKVKQRSPKLTVRKKSLPNLMIRKALTNSLNQATSFESLENRSISNLDHVNPPSILADVELLDLEGSMISVASLQSEAEDVKTDFLINGFVSENRHNAHPMFNVKVPYSEIENVNPPSIFNEITDICNSLADVQTEAMGTETEIFEDCMTHLDNDATLFSDANSSTPLESDLSSNDSTPKKQRKILTPKERRNLSKDRYKTYTIDLQASEDYVTCTSKSSPKMTAREKRLNNRSRFETQVIDETILKKFESSSSKETISETSTSSTLTSTSITESTLNGNTQSNIRKNFIQKRLENRDRFKTKVISGNSSPGLLITSPNSPDLHYLLQKEANTVLKTLNETKTKVDELLECETLSLVSNEEDSEQNSGGSNNYRTYHKSWGLNQPHIPVVDQQSDDTSKTNELDSFEIENIENSNESSDCENEVKPGKPKIVKPGDVVTPSQDEDKTKAIRGHRKSLYHRSNVKTPPSKIVSPTPINKSPTNKNLLTKTPPKNINKTPSNSKLIKPTMKSTNIPTQKNNQPKSQSPIKSNSPKQHSNSASTKSPNLERQGTFVEEEKPKTVSGIPKSASKIPSASNIPKPSKIARATPPPKSIPKPQKTPPLNNQDKPKSFYRSPSVDAKDVTKRSSLQPSTSSQSLKNGGVVKRSSMPETTNQRNGSNGSLASNGSNSKQITSKIASLWKKVEESKKISSKTIDKRVWIQPEQQKLIRSNTFDNKDELQENQGKRISRLGSFVVVEGESNV